MKWTAFVSLSALILSACGAVDEVNLQAEAIAPQDFALLPCGPKDSNRPCVLAIAGGKRLLFGAPIGIEGTVSDNDLRQLDAVFLFSHRAIDLQGLADVRNRSWRAGRSKPLAVYGPAGTGRIISAMNLTYEQADALRIVDEGIPPGGFDAAILIAGQSGAAGVDFDTGDVQVQQSQRADQSLIFDVLYQGQPVLSLQKCQQDDCMINDELNWPLSETYFVYKHSEN